MFSSARGGYGTEIRLGIVQHERRASVYSPCGYRYALRLSKAKKNQVLAIIWRIKIFVLTEPLAAQAHRLDEAPQGIPKTVAVGTAIADRRRVAPGNFNRGARRRPRRLSRPYSFALRRAFAGAPFSRGAKHEHGRGKRAIGFLRRSQLLHAAQGPPTPPPNSAKT
jgi:hypothetical protein